MADSSRDRILLQEIVKDFAANEASALDWGEINPCETLCLPRRFSLRLAKIRRLRPLRVDRTTNDEADDRFANRTRGKQRAHEDSTDREDLGLRLEGLRPHRKSRSYGRKQY